jgi:hypothetical protein
MRIDPKISKRKSSWKKRTIFRLGKLKFRHSTRTFSVKKESMNCKTDSRVKEALLQTKRMLREVLLVLTSIFILKIQLDQVLIRIHHQKSNFMGIILILN